MTTFAALLRHTLHSDFFLGDSQYVFEANHDHQLSDWSGCNAPGTPTIGRLCVMTIVRLWLSTATPSFPVVVSVGAGVGEGGTEERQRRRRGVGEMGFRAMPMKIAMETFFHNVFSAPMVVLSGTRGWGGSWGAGAGGSWGAGATGCPQEPPPPSFFKDSLQGPPTDNRQPGGR